LAQHCGALAEKFEMIFGLYSKTLRLSPCPFDPHGGDEIGLAARRILVHRLAQRFGVTFVIQDVVDNLIGQPQIVGISLDRKSVV